MKKCWMLLSVAALAAMLSGCTKTPEQKLAKGIETGDALMVQQAIQENVKLTEVEGIKGKPADALLGTCKDAQVRGLINDYIVKNTIALGNAKTVDEAKAQVAKGVRLGFISMATPSALHLAVRNNNLDVVKYIISLGADINLCGKNPHFPPALGEAIKADNIELAKELIALGASLQTLNGYDELIPDYKNGNITGDDLKKLMRRTETCVRIGWLDPKKIFEYYEIWDIWREKDWREKEHMAFIKLLVELGMPVNAKKKEEYTPLSLAVRHNDIELVKLLIEKGAKADKSTLIKAMENGNLESVKMMLEKGAASIGVDDNIYCINNDYILTRIDAKDLKKSIETAMKKRFSKLDYSVYDIKKDKNGNYNFGCIFNLGDGSEGTLAVTLKGVITCYDCGVGLLKILRN